MELKTEHLDEIIELENLIRDSINLDPSKIYFHYHHSEAGGVRADIITINTSHKEKFLFHSVIRSTKQYALEDALEYCKKYKKDYNSYTVEWANKGESNSNKSYFFALDMIEVVDKFYYGHDRSKFVIYLIKMNPIS